MKKILLTCLLVGTMVMMMCMSAFASDSNIKLPSNPDSSKYDSYVVFKQDGKYYCVYYDSVTYTPVYYSGYWNSSLGSNQYIMFMSRSGETGSSSNYEYSTSTDSASWSVFSSASCSYETISNYSIADASTFKSYNSISILDANKSIYNSNGVEVFQWTPPLTMAQKVILSVEEALANLLATVGGVMKVLLLCGVGCLALLTGLKLFGKVLPIFRV